MSDLVLAVLPISSILLIATTFGLLAVYRPSFYLCLVISYVALNNVMPFSIGEVSINLGALTLFPMDALAIIATFAGVVCWLMKTRQSRSNFGSGIVAGLTGMALIGIWIWSGIYGLQFAFRSEWSLLLEGLMMARYVHAQRHQLGTREIERISLVGASLVSLFAISRIMTHGLGSSDIYNEAIQGGTARPTTAAGAFIVLVGLIVLINPNCQHFIKAPAAKRVFIFSFALLVILLQHRSVWVGALLCLLIWALTSESRLTVSRSIRVAILGVCGIGILGAIRFLPQLQESSTNTNTLDWRTKRWQESLTTPRSVEQWFFGATFGPTPVSNPDGFQVYAHSAYIDSIERVGLVGLLLLLLLYFLAIRKHRNTSSQLLCAMFVVATLGYSVTYRFPPSSWIILPILLWGNVQSMLPASRQSLLEIGDGMYSVNGESPDQNSVSFSPVADHPNLLIPVAL